MNWINLLTTPQHHHGTQRQCFLRELLYFGLAFVQQSCSFVHPLTSRYFNNNAFQDLRQMLQSKKYSVSHLTYKTENYSRTALLLDQEITCTHVHDSTHVPQPEVICAQSIYVGYYTCVLFQEDENTFHQLPQLNTASYPKY